MAENFMSTGEYVASEQLLASVSSGISNRPQRLRKVCIHTIRYSVSMTDSSERKALTILPDILNLASLVKHLKQTSR